MLARSTGAGCSFSSGRDAQLGPTSARLGRLSLGSRSQLEIGVVLPPVGGSIGLSQHVYRGPFTVTFGQVGVSLGHDKLIAMLGRILSTSHAVPPPGTIMRSVGAIIFPTHIGNDVWLGAGVTVLGGVTIGAGYVVGAGAVVSRDLPPNSIALGVPARVVRMRT